MLIDIGLDVEIAAACTRYIEEGGIFPDHVPIIQFPRHSQPQGVGEIWSHIRKLHQKGKEPDLLGRLFALLLRIGQESFLEASCGYVDDALWRRGCLTLMSSYEIPLALLWQWFLDHEELSGRMEKHRFVFIAHVAEREPELIHAQLQLADKFNRLIMTAHLIIAENAGNITSTEFEQELMVWIENEMMTDRQTIKIATEVMQAIQSNASVEDIKQLAKKVEWGYSYFKDWLQQALYIAEITQGTVPFSESLLRIFILLDPIGFYWQYSSAVKYDWDRRMLEVPNYYAKHGVPRELYIRQITNNYNKVQLRAELARDRVEYERAIVASSKLETLYLCLFLWEETEGYPYLDVVEENFLDNIEGILVSEEVPAEDMLELMEFFRGAPLTENLKSKWLQYRGSNKTFRSLSIAAEHLWPHSILYNRIICFLVHTDVVTLIMLCSWTMRNGLDFEGFLRAYQQAGGELLDLVPFLLKTAPIDLVHPDNHAWSQQTIQYMNDNRSHFMEHLAYYLTTHETIPDEKCFILSFLMTYDADEFAGLSIKYLADDSKLVRDKTVKLLASSSQLIASIIPLLSHKKSNIRESVVRLVSGWDDDQSIRALQELYVREKNAKIKELLSNKLQGILELTPSSPIEPEVLSSPLINLIWLEPATLPILHNYESGEESEAHVCQAIISAYANQGEISRNWKAHELASPLRVDDLAELAYEVLNRWLNKGAEANKKWVLAFTTAFGDERVVSVLQERIQAWPLESRGAIACEAVRALLLSPLDSALVFIDQISRKFKFKQIKLAAADAFTQAAILRGISTEELADLVIPTLGFDARGCQTIHYGSRQFRIELLLSHDLRITDKNGKLYKTLPTPGESDDSALAKAAYVKFKQLKKQLKTIRESFHIRLEQSLVTRRRWSFADWHKLFIDNTIQHGFAAGLVWGVYTGNELAATFRYIEDGSFSTIDENEITLLADDLIGLVHPLELGNEEKQQWKQHIEDYEVKQPILQLNRTIFTAVSRDIEETNVMDYAGVTINGFSLLGAMNKFGWSKGSVVDGGSYYEYFKEFEMQGIGANLTFSGVSVGMEDETVTIYELEFYRSGTVARGSYVYSDIKDDDRIRPIDIPCYLFSELMYEIDSALVKRIGKDEDWQLNRD